MAETHWGFLVGFGTTLHFWSWQYQGAMAWWVKMARTRALLFGGLVATLMKEKVLGMHEIIAKDQSFELIPNLLTFESGFVVFGTEKIVKVVGTFCWLFWRSLRPAVAVKFIYFFWYFLGHSTIQRASHHLGLGFLTLSPGLSTRGGRRASISWLHQNPQCACPLNDTINFAIKVCIFKVNFYT